jgi:hypothetical protein
MLDLIVESVWYGAVPIAVLGLLMVVFGWVIESKEDK